MQNDDITNYPKRPKSEAEESADAQDNESKTLTVGPVAVETWHMVAVQLNEEQQQAIQKITGEKITKLKILLEDLVDLSDLVAN